LNKLNFNLCRGVIRKDDFDLLPVVTLTLDQVMHNLIDSFLHAQRFRKIS